MNPSTFLRLAVPLVGIITVVAFAGCHDSATRSPTPPNAARPAVQPLALALAPHSGASRLDEQIRHFQNQVRSNSQTRVSLERLGWLYVAKARETFDPGFYTLAEQSALALDARQPGCVEALLLRGHTLQSQHRFKEAEPLARRLVASRGLATDYGLLGDILLDLGRLNEAAEAYQSMLDLRPDPQGYARAAQLRWLKGDLDGALEAMRLAVTSVSPQDADSAAWMHTQYARFLWQAGQSEEATAAIRDALILRTDFAPALLLKGRMLLADRKFGDAISSLQSAVRLNPLPDYQWTLAEALRVADREQEADAIEHGLMAGGPGADPRTCALFLATRKLQSASAVRLARQELADRQDVFTHDALAWALFFAGDFEAAKPHLRAALAEGTQDARLWLHAGIICRQLGEMEDSRRWLQQAEQARAQLLPSEQSLLRGEITRLTKLSAAHPATPKTFSAAAVSGTASED